jgi:hypothetical protein
MEEETSASAFAKEVTRLWRAWRTVHEMVQDRVCRCQQIQTTSQAADEAG